MKKIYYTIITVFLLTSCSKDWLEAKRDISVIVPSTLKDMRLLLNNHFPTAYDSKILMELSTDDYFLTETYFNSRTELERNYYIWKDNPFDGIRSLSDWDESYTNVLYANVVLEGLKNIDRTINNQVEYDDVKGNALVRRSRSFFTLVELFAKPYNEATANQDLGIPLKLSPEINEPIIRATLQDTYTRIIDDLKEAAGLLKPIPAYKTDSSRPAVHGLLARVLLSMERYEDAHHYADLYLQEAYTLLDFNTLNPNPTYPITIYQNNPEVILFGYPGTNFGALYFANANILREIYDSFDEHDLRKKIFFIKNANDEYGFRGNYTTGAPPFTGISTNEIYLIRAECAARANDVDGAMRDLNTLLEKRFITGTFQDYTASNADEALRVVLTERRKELLRRGLRWSDLRRLNKDSRFQTTIKRIIGDQEYVLEPNSSRYTFPIPQYVIESNGIPQN